MSFELARAYVTVASNMGEMSRGLAQGEGALRSSVGNMQNSLNNLSGTLNGLLGMFGFAATGMGLYQLAKQLIFATDSVEKMKNSFTTMLKGNSAQADLLIGKMKKFTALTPFSEEQVSSAVMQFLPFSKNMDELFDTITAIGDAAATSARGLASFPQVARGFSQMMGKGRISAEEMMQLGEAGIPVWDTLARAIGKSGPETRKMVETGKLGMADIKKFVKAIGEDYAGNMEKQSKSVEGLLSTISDNVKMTAITAFRPIYDAVQGIMSRMAEFVQSPAFATMAESVTSGIRIAMEWIKTAVSAIAKWWNTLSPQFQKAAMFAGVVGPALALAIPILSTMFGLLSGILPIMAGVGAAVWAATTVWQYFGDEIMAGIHWILVFASNWQKSWEIIKLATQIGITTMQEWFINFFTVLGQRWDKLLAAVIDMALMGWTTIFKSLFAAFGAVDWGALGDAFGNVIKTWMAYQEGLVAGLAVTFTWIVDNWRDVMQRLLDIMQAALGAMPTLWQTAIQSMLTGKSIGTSLVDGFKAAMTQVQNAANGTFALGKDAAEQFGIGFGQQFAAAKERLGVTQGLGEAFGTIGDQVTSAASAAAQAGLANIQEKIGALNQELALLSTFEESDTLAAQKAQLANMITGLESEYNAAQAKTAATGEGAAEPGSTASEEFAGREDQQGTGMGAKGSPFIGFAEFNKKMQESLMDDKPLQIAEKQLTQQELMTEQLASINSGIAMMSGMGAGVGGAVMAMKPEVIYGT